MTAWAVVILAALGSRVVIPVSWQVVALAASVSLGLCVGGVVGAVLARSVAGAGERAVLAGVARSLICLPAAGVAGGLVALAGDAAAGCRSASSDAGRDRRGRPVHDDLRWSRLPRRPKPGRCAVELLSAAAAWQRIDHEDRSSTDREHRRHRPSRRECGRPSGPARPCSTDLCTRCRPRGRQRLDDLGADVLPLSRLGRLAGADVVHAHGYKAGAIALGASAFRRVPLVVTWHNAVLGQGWSAVAAGCCKSSWPEAQI